MIAVGSVAPPAYPAPDSGASKGGQVYKWTDDKGVVHYGDSVPPEYAQSQRSVLNSQGVEIDRVEGRLNAAQAAEQQRAGEAAKLRAQHDQFLLATYASTKDIEQLRDERLDQIDGQIKASSLYIDSLAARLQALQERSRHFKPYSDDPNARRMPDELAEELVRTSNENRSQRLALEAKRTEAADVRTQFDTDITRYRELTARHAQ
ncbi:MAG: DUF4124 domain-containing protein [Steroidobacterales bacterium]